MIGKTNAVVVSGGLPSGYTALEYLQSTGTQYIDTEYKPSNTTRWTVDAYIEAVSGRVAIMGARAYYSQLSYWFGKGSSGSNTLYAGFKNSNLTGNNTYFNARHVYDFNNGGKLYVDTNAAISLGTPTFTVPYSLFLFATNDDYQSSGSPYARSLCTNTKVYGSKIYEGDELKADFVPCLDRSNVPCMYDLVRRKTHYNQGTGTFNYG